MTPAFLYRHFDGEGRLLYIGASVWPIRRQAAHMASSAWAFEIRRIDIEPFPTKEEAYAAERLAQETEGPLYNVPNNKFRPSLKAARLAACREAVDRRGQAELTAALAEIMSSQ